MGNKKLKKKVGSAITLCIIIVLISGFIFLYNGHQAIEKEMYLKKGLHIYQGMRLSNVLKQELIKVYEEKNSLENFPVPKKKMSSKYIKSATSDEKGRIRIDYAKSIAKDKYLILLPELNDAKELVWRCGETNLDLNVISFHCENSIKAKEIGRAQSKTNQKERGEKLS